jgi:hypothetical protein
MVSCKGCGRKTPWKILSFAKRGWEKPGNISDTMVGNWTENWTRDLQDTKQSSATFGTHQNITGKDAPRLLSPYTVSGFTQAKFADSLPLILIQILECSSISSDIASKATLHTTQYSQLHKCYKSIELSQSVAINMCNNRQFCYSAHTDSLLELVFC